MGAGANRGPCPAAAAAPEWRETADLDPITTMRDAPILAALLLACGALAGCTPPPGEPAPSRAVRFVCGDFAFSVMYEEDAAVLVIEDRVVPLQRGEDGRYTGGGFTFWEGQGRAHLEKAGAVYRDCYRKVGPT